MPCLHGAWNTFFVECGMHAISVWNMHCLLCGAPDSRWSVEHGVPTEVEYLLTTKRLKLHILAKISSL